MFTRIQGRVAPFSPAYARPPPALGRESLEILGNFCLVYGDSTASAASAAASLAVACAIYPQGNRNDFGRCFHLLKLQLMTMNIFLFYIFSEVSL